MFVCSFVDENGNQYNGTTTLRINGTDVLAINSPKVMNDQTSNELPYIFLYRYSAMGVNIILTLICMECYWRMRVEVVHLGMVTLAMQHECTSCCSSHWETRTMSYEIMIAAGAEFESP